MITAIYFTEEEFAACTPVCSLQDMRQTTIDRLDQARQAADIPFVLSSAYRTSEWDMERGRSGTGAHTMGCAVDIRCRNSAARWKIVESLIAAGFGRIGIARTFIHADDSDILSKNVMWLY